MSDKTETIVSRIYKQDNLAQYFGMRLEAARPGYASVSMLIRREMLNGLGICHGGVTFALADTAFAYACNGRNQKTVALACSISYSAAVKEGDTITAVAEEKSLSKSTGTYDVEISNQHGEVVALFRGTSSTVKKALFPDLE